MSLRLLPEWVVAAVGFVLIGCMLVLYGLAPLPFFAAILGLFTVLGVLVARDARRLGQRGLRWGLATLVFGPFAVILYAWFRAGLQESERRLGRGGLRQAP